MCWGSDRGTAPDHRGRGGVRGITRGAQNPAPAWYGVRGAPLSPQRVETSRGALEAPWPAVPLELKKGTSDWGGAQGSAQPSVAVSQTNRSSVARSLIFLFGARDVLRPAGHGLHPRPTSGAASAPQMGMGMGVGETASVNFFPTVLLLAGTRRGSDPLGWRAAWAREGELGGWPGASAWQTGRRADGRAARSVERCWSLSGKGAHCSGRERRAALKAPGRLGLSSLVSASWARVPGERGQGPGLRRPCTRRGARNVRGSLIDKCALPRDRGFRNLGFRVGLQRGSARRVIITTPAQRFPKLSVFGVSFWVDRASGEARVGRGSRFRPSETSSAPRGSSHRPPPVLFWSSTPNPHKYDSIESPAGTFQARDARDFAKQKGKSNRTPSPAPIPPSRPREREKGG